MPYKTVGRVRNATKDIILGLDFLDGNGKPIEPDPFAYGVEANRAVQAKAVSACLDAMYQPPRLSRKPAFHQGSADAPGSRRGQPDARGKDLP